MKIYLDFRSQPIVFRATAIYPELTSYTLKDSESVPTPSPSSAIRLEGYECELGLERKMTVVLDYEEAQDWAKRLAEAVAKAPCPTCKRHDK